MAWARCPVSPNTLRVHTEYVLVKSCELNHECRGLKYISLPFSVMPKDRWCRHLSSLREISPSEFVLSPVWCSKPRPMTGVLLAPCHNEFHEPCSDYIRQVYRDEITLLQKCDDFQNKYPHVTGPHFFFNFLIFIA
ncbi:uncharacterized protein TNCV_4419861 [Trichonephila clavipes]|nr:uncharacterized protein TNCV_4419861 [Trichonephila clavipes]